MSLWQLKACEQEDPNAGPEAPSPEDHDLLKERFAHIH